MDVTREISTKKVNGTGKVSMNGIMGIDTRGRSKTASAMAKGFLSGIMEIDTRETTAMAVDMGGVPTFGRPARDTMVNTLSANEKVEVSSRVPMVRALRDGGKKTRSTVMEFSLIPMVEGLKTCG
tara:strand:+ start:176 stop:550 length:375 start_codon:yes stop_codon:yes gene_type:complete